jgi:hypothetical protein
MLGIQTQLGRARRYIAAAALLIVALATVAVVRPTWFVAPNGRIPLFGGPFLALLFAWGLWSRLRSVYLLTLAGTAAWAWVAMSRYGEGMVGAPMAHLILACAMTAAFVLLLGPRSVRRYFFDRAA